MFLFSPKVLGNSVIGRLFTNVLVKVYFSNWHLNLTNFMSLCLMLGRDGMDS